MSEIVDADMIETIVGATRHPVRHIARADSQSQKVFVLHSGKCKSSGIDLRECIYSEALDRGIHERNWRDYEDRAVYVGIDGGRLVPTGTVDYT